MFLFNRRFGAQTAGDVFFHPAHPALGIGKHPVSFKNLQLFFVGRCLKHPVNAHPKLFDGFRQALQFTMRIVRNGVCNHDAGFMQPDMAFGRTFLTGCAAGQNRLLMTGGKRGTFADKGAKFGHFGDHHRHNFQGVNFIGGKFTGIAGLNDKNPQGFAQPLNRQAQER